VANESVIVSFDGTNLASGAVNVGSDGEFTATVTIPDDTPEGEHEITASDSAGTEATETFEVEDTGASSTGTSDEDETPSGNVTSGNTTSS
jgi:hypothetical protein